MTQQDKSCVNSLKQLSAVQRGEVSSRHEDQGTTDGGKTTPHKQNNHTEDLNSNQVSHNEAASSKTNLTGACSPGNRLDIKQRPRELVSQPGPDEYPSQEYDSQIMTTEKNLDASNALLGIDLPHERQESSATIVTQVFNASMRPSMRAFGEDEQGVSQVYETEVSNRELNALDEERP